MSSLGVAVVNVVVQTACDRGEIVIYIPTICLIFNWEDVDSQKLKHVSD